MWADLTANQSKEYSNLPTQLSQLLPAVVESFLTTPVSLFSFNNEFLQTNSNVREVYGEPVSWFTFVQHWATGYTFDAKTSFAWGLGEI